MNVVGLLLAVGASLGTAACAASLESAKSSYDKGDYAGAKAALVEIEKAEIAKGGCARAEYELFRGLTHLGLGDKANAKQWLEWARGHNEVLLREKLQTCFGKRDLTRLDLAIETAGR